MILLAGGIGSGKSVVARVLRLRGFGVFDCDLEARMLMESDAALRSRLEEVAGADIYDAEGRLRRRLLASRIYSEADLRHEVNAAVHAAVRKRIEEWLHENRAHIFVECAIASRSGVVDMASEVWLVSASPQTRLERVGTRDGRTLEEILRIMEAQKGEEEALAGLGQKIRRIINEPGDSLLAQIPREFDKF